MKGVKYDLKWLGPQMFGVTFPDGRPSSTIGSGDTYATITVSDDRPANIIMALVDVPRLIEILSAAGCRDQQFDDDELCIFDATTGTAFLKVEPAKKVLSDRCPRCDIRGQWGARATLLCPQCNYVIGGLG